MTSGLGTISLPQLDGRQTGHQRAFLKIQDGCDAHCTYCIIPRLRPHLWSKPIEQTVSLLVERDEPDASDPGLRHGRCERYFPVHFEGDGSLVGRMVHVRIDRVSPQRTWGTLLGSGSV